MSVNLQEQYDKIFRFCFYKVRSSELAEDLTQEAFLRFLENPQYHGKNKDLQYLYRIAGNLCADYFRKKKTVPLEDDIPEDMDREDIILTHVALGEAVKKLSEEDRELVMLRFVNEVPIGVLSQIYGVSRFKMSRRLKKIIAGLQKELG